MKFKIGEICSQIWNEDLGNVKIIKHFGNSTYVIKYVREEYNNGNYGTDAGDNTYLFSETYLSKIIIRKKEHLPEWL